MSNDSVLISKGKWFERHDFTHVNPFDVLWKEYEHKLEQMLLLTSAIATSPVTEKQIIELLNNPLHAIDSTKQKHESISKSSSPPPVRIKSVIDVSGEVAEMLRIERCYMLPDGLAVEVTGSPVAPPTPHTFVQQQFNKAIELLEACSEDLFVSGDDADLETRIDEFIKKVKQS